MKQIVEYHHEDRIAEIAWSPDSTRLLVCSKDKDEPTGGQYLGGNSKGKLTLWSLKNTKEPMFTAELIHPRSLRWRDSGIHCFSINDGEDVGTTARVIQFNQELEVIRTSNEILIRFELCLHMSPDGKSFVNMGSIKGTGEYDYIETLEFIDSEEILKLRDYRQIQEDELVREYEKLVMHQEPLFFSESNWGAFDYSPDGQYLAVYSDFDISNKPSYCLRFIDTGSWETVGEVHPFGANGPSYPKNKRRERAYNIQIDWSPDSNYVAVSTRHQPFYKSKTVIIDAVSGKKVRTLKGCIDYGPIPFGYNPMRNTTWSPCGELMTLNRYPRKDSGFVEFVILQTKDWTDLFSEKHEMAIGCFIPKFSLWSNDGRYIAIVFQDTSRPKKNLIRVYDTDTIERVKKRKWIVEPTIKHGYVGSEKELEDILEKNPNLLGFGYEVIGRQFPVGDGRIDLLMKRSNGGLIVVELKKDEADDVVVGQILRYLSWIAKEYPDNVQPVGIIVAEDFSENLKMAIVGSIYNIQLIPVSMIWANYRS